MRERPVPPPATAWPGTLALALAVLGWTLAVCATAGFSFSLELGPARVSLRHATNPAVASVLCLAFSAWWLGPRAFAELAGWVEGGVVRHATWLAALLSVLVVLASWHWGAFVAGGTDSSGYLHQARLWQEGLPRTVAVRIDGITFEQGLRAVTPVGFRQAEGGGDALVPMYPPGYPMAMAAASRLAGHSAQFGVVPMAAGALTIAAFLLGRVVGGPIAGLLAAGATASSPTLLYQAFQPMSDVPAAAAWLVATSWLVAPSAVATVGAALAIVVACLTRPNLFAMAPLLVLAAFWWAPSRRQGTRRAAIVTVAAGLSAVGYAWWQRQMYGAADESGYGAIGTLFSATHVWPNLLNYPRWLVEAHGYALCLGLAAPLLAGFGESDPARRHAARRVMWWSMIMCVALLGFYALYLPFDNWAYSRFLLPALPLAFVLSAATVSGVLARVALPWRALVALLLIVAVPIGGLARARDAHAFALHENEQRYTEVAAFAGSLPASAVFLCMQHSGSLAYYTRRPIVRWDWLEAHEVDRALAAMAAAGHDIYAVLDDWEVAAFQSRFPGSETGARLGAPVFRSHQREAVNAQVYLVQPAAVSGR